MRSDEVFIFVATFSPNSIVSGVLLFHNPLEGDMREVVLFCEIGDSEGFTRTYLVRQIPNGYYRESEMKK